MQIRKMEEKDIETVYEMLQNIEEFRVSKESKMGEWVKQSLKNWIKNKDDEMLVAEENGEVVGFIFTTAHKPSGKATIENIFVKEEFRGKGISKKLLDECIARLKKKGINYFCSLVKENNKKAFEFFKSNNFTEGYKFVWMEKAG